MLNWRRKEGHGVADWKRGHRVPAILGRLMLVGSKGGEERFGPVRTRGTGTERSRTTFLHIRDSVGGWIGRIDTGDKPDRRAGTASKADRSQGSGVRLLCLPPAFAAERSAAAKAAFCRCSFAPRKEVDAMANQVRSDWAVWGFH